MRFRPIDVQTPTWSQSDYGEPVATYSEAVKVPMFIGWINAMKNEVEGSIYQQYDFVGLTKADIEVGSLVDGRFEVGYKDNTGRLNRVFMNYAEGADRTYG
jgi:hypothetical protein